MNPRPWRIAAYLLIAVTAAFGSYLAFTSGSRAAKPVANAFELSAQLGPGPRPGDLHSVLAPTPEPLPEPSPVEFGAPAAKRSQTRARPAVKPAPKPQPTKNPFRDLPGGGVLGDMCSGGRC